MPKARSAWISGVASTGPMVLTAMLWLDRIEAAMRVSTFSSDQKAANTAGIPGSDSTRWPAWFSRFSACETSLG